MSGPAPERPRDPRRAAPGPNRANLAALLAVAVIAALGYWAFTAIARQREIARCLDEGRRDCLELVKPRG